MNTKLYVIFVVKSKHKLVDSLVNFTIKNK